MNIIQFRILKNEELKIILIEIRLAIHFYSESFEKTTNFEKLISLKSSFLYIAKAMGFLFSSNISDRYIINDTKNDKTLSSSDISFLTDNCLCAATMYDNIERIYCVIDKEYYTKLQNK